MNPMNAFLAQSIMDEHLARAQAYRRAHPRREERILPEYDGVTIRRATPDDWSSLERLAQLEGRRRPTGPALLAEVDGCVLAARWLESGETMADPFQPTDELVALLEARAAHLGYRARAVTRPLRAVTRFRRRAYS